MATAISNNNANKRWKYLSFALIGILAAGSTVSFLPQASAHITTSVQHMLEEIYRFVDGIEAKTNNLPADPASNTVVNTRASQTSVNALQTTANTINTKVDSLSTSSTGSSGFNTLVNQELTTPYHLYKIVSDKPYIANICVTNVVDLGFRDFTIIKFLKPDNSALPTMNTEVAKYDTKCIVTSNTEPTNYDLGVSLNHGSSWQGIITVQARDGAIVTITPIA